MSLIQNGNSDYSGSPRARHWSFGEWELDELAHELRHRGNPVELESKPIEILLQLLLHAGEVMTKAELLETVWPGTSVVDGSLTTAISKLRRVFGEGQDYILTVSRVGYRFAAPVHLRIGPVSTRVDLGFQPGASVPGREQWRFVRCIGNSGAGEVWLAENPRTRETRVFKFATDAAQLSGLKREVTISRFLRDSLGERTDFVRVLEWNFESAPYFIESEYAGEDLAEWALKIKLSDLPLESCLQVVIDIADSLALAHGVGVLHKDLKPANILVSSASDGLQIRIADFGNSSLSDPARLSQLGITNIGFTREGHAERDPLTGTLMYLAPEVLAGHVPTIAADVYALGIILYQILAGDFRRPLSPGWESEISDPLLRRDIADAACGDPGRRLSSASDLADRLRNLPTRRIEQTELERVQQRALVAEREVAISRARRPWIATAAVALTAGAALSLVLYFRAAADRNQAQQQTAIATSINRFLSEDLLASSDPFRSGKADESFTEVISRASPRIDPQFANQPLVAARLHQTIARALDGRTDYDGARREYDQAARLFASGKAADPEAATVVQLQRAAMEARTYQKGSLERAKTLLAAQEAIVPTLKQPSGQVQVWLASARGMVALIDNDAKAAAQNFQAAVDGGSHLPSFDQTARLTLEQRLAFAYIRLGDGDRAERQARSLIAAFSSLEGPESPHVLRVRLTLAQALMIQGKHEGVIQEVNAIYPQFVARLGPGHELSMQLLTTRAQSEGSLELWNDAIRDDLAIHAIAIQKQGPLSFFAIATLSDAALAQCRAGKTAEGIVNARKSFDDAAKSFGPRAGLTGGTAYALAACMISLKHMPEAEKLLTNIDIPAVAQLAGISDWGANVDLARAHIAYSRTDYQSARELLKKAAPAFQHAGAEPYQKRAAETLTAALDRR